MDIKEKVADLIKQGYEQISRKYRMLGRLPEGKTGLEALREVDPRLAQHFLDNANNAAKDQYIRCYTRGEPYRIELTREEFDEFLRQTGRHGFAKTEETP
jgi:hypothetical protein